MSLTNTVSLNIVNAQTVVAGTPSMFGPFQLINGYAATLNWSVTNGSTGPTGNPTVQIVSTCDWNSGTPAGIQGNYGGPMAANVGNSVVTNIGGIQLPAPAGAFYLVVSCAGQNITFSADMVVTTAV